MSKRLQIYLLLLLFYTPVASAQYKPRIALVLTGGGSRGVAQIGALRQLLAHDIKPDVIVGTSIGAIVGGLYCVGYSPDQIDSMFQTVDWSEVNTLGNDTQRESLFFSQKQESDRNLLTLRFRDFAFIPPKSIGGSARFVSMIQHMLWRSPLNLVRNFDLLPCQFRAVATNLKNGKWVAMKSGNLATAMRASATFPLRYAPVIIGDSILVDGGLVANIPVEAAREMKPDIIIVVNTVSEYLQTSELRSAMDIADQALSASMKQRDAFHLASADVVITPDLGAHRNYDFTDLPEMIKKGAVATSESIAAIRTRISEVVKKRAQVPENYAQFKDDSVMLNTMILKSEILASSPIRDIPAIANAAYEMTGRTWSKQFTDFWSSDISRALHAAGYPLGYVRAMAFDSSNNALTVHADLGRINRIYRDPSRLADSSDVMSEITFEPGDSITIEDLEKSADNLRASDLLDDPDIAVYPARDSGVDVVVGALDRGNQMIKFGARIDNERYGQLGIDLIQQNLFKSGLRASARGVLSQRIGEFSLALDIPRIAGTLWTASLRGYTSFRNVWIYTNSPTVPVAEPVRLRTGEFSEDRNGARLSVGRQLERNGVILAELRYELQRYRDLSSETKPTFQPLTTAKISVRWDDRDRIDFPNSGRVIDLFLESSLLNLSNGLSFTKASAQVQSIFNVGGVVVTPSFLIGAADRTLPSPELFSLGGQELFYGMRQDEERGRQITAASLDVRVKMPFSIFFDTYLSARYDLGSVWANPELIRIGDMRHGVGLSLGLDTPVGPATFSVGRRFYFLDNPAAVAVGNLLAYFSIGARL